MQILLIENNERDRQLFRRLVKQHNLEANEGRLVSETQPEMWTLATQNSIDQAITYLSSPPPGGQPDILVVDLSLQSGDDGLSLITLVSRDHPQLPLLVWSQSSSAETWFSSADRGATGFVSKNHPLDHWELSRHIHFALSSKRDVAVYREEAMRVQDGIEYRGLGIAHELTRQLNILGSLIGLDDKARAHTRIEAMKKLVSAIWRAHDQLYLNRIERTVFDINQLTQSIIETNSWYWKEIHRLVSLDISVTNATPVGTIAADEHKIAWILENVLENAMKVQRGGCARVNVELVLRSEVNVSWVEIMVRDFGPGASTYMLDHVFKRGIVGTDRTQQSGWGIGLHHSFQLARLHECRGRIGDIKIQKAEGEPGAIVVILIPFDC